MLYILYIINIYIYYIVSLFCFFKRHFSSEFAALIVVIYPQRYSVIK